MPLVSTSSQLVRSLQCRWFATRSSVWTLGFLSCFAVAVLNAASAQIKSKPIDPRFMAIDSIARQLADSGFSGVVLAAIRDTVLLHRAYTARGIRITRPDTSSSFWIGSMTKGFTAAAILRLQEQGKLSVRDSLIRFFRNAPVDNRGITIQQLLTHTSRLSGISGGTGMRDRSSAVRAILAQPRQFSPGNGYRYIDDDYQLLAAVVEIASGKSWEDYVSSELLRPAGMTRTGFWCRTAPRASPRLGGPDGLTTRCPSPGGDWGHRGANGMSSTASDLYRWVRALDRGRILSARSRAQLYAPQVAVRREPPATISYGYGVRVYTVNGKTTEVMHTGSADDGHTGMVRVLRDGQVIIVLSNAGQHRGTTWASYVAHRVGGPLGID